MNIKNIENYIKKIFKKNKRRNNKSIVLNKMKQTTFIKKRKQIVFNYNFFEKFKLFWNNKSYYYISIIVTLLIIAIYIIFWPIFKVKYVDTIKQDDLTNMIISYDSVNKYRWRSIFTIDKKEILKSLQNYQQNIRDIKVNIILPNKLRIIIDSYKWIFNTKINNKSFVITENWTLIPNKFSWELEELKIKHKIDKNKFLDYKKIFDTKYIKEINNINKLIKENIINIKVNELTYFVVERELHLKTENNTTIIFDLNKNIQNQLEKIVIFNKDQLNINKNPIIYIDLRIKNKVFYCTNENEYQCYKNIKSIYPYE